MEEKISTDIAENNLPSADMLSDVSKILD